jgi:hypothetical protein
LYPIGAAAGIILCVVYLNSLLDLNWVLLKENPVLVNIIAMIAIGAIVVLLMLFFYCYAQLMRLIVQHMSWEDLEKELQEIKKKGN